MPEKKITWPQFQHTFAPFEAHMTLASVRGNLTEDILCDLCNFLIIFRTLCKNSESYGVLLKTK